MFYQARAPQARTNPLRSIAMFRPASTVLPWTEMQTAEWNLAIAKQNVELDEKYLAAAYAGLGAANREHRATRRMWQAKAFRRINQNRSALRASRIALVAAQAAVLALAPATPAA
jgi:hypothetical protein